MGEQDVRTGGKDKGARTKNKEQEGVRNGEREFGLGCFRLELLPGHPGKSSSVIGSLGPNLQKRPKPLWVWGGIEKLREVSEA